MNETLRTLTTRKSCRAFTSARLTRGELDLIVSAGLNAPSGMNRQTPRFVVIQDEDTIAQLSKLNAGIAGMEYDPFYGSKNLIVVLAKKEMTYIYDGALAMGNLLNAAWSMGIDCRWIHRAKEVFASPEGQALLETWGITEEVEGIGFCVLGHAPEDFEKKPTNPGRVFYV